MGKAQKNINLVFLLLFSAYAIYSVFYLNASLFFIIYLFWFDELIRNISMFIQVKIHAEDSKINPEFSKQTALSFIKARFFFLFIYFVFIVIVYGLFFHLGTTDRDALVKNVKIFFFRDLSFNICLMIAIVREAIQIRVVGLNRTTKLPTLDAMNGHLITLHLSIILGALLWALTTGKFDGFKLDLGAFNKYAVALPFFIIKFLVDIHQISQSEKGNKSSFQTLRG